MWPSAGKTHDLTLNCGPSHIFPNTRKLKSNMFPIKIKIIRKYRRAHASLWLQKVQNLGELERNSNATTDKIALFNVPCQLWENTTAFWFECSEEQYWLLSHYPIWKACCENPLDAWLLFIRGSCWFISKNELPLIHSMKTLPVFVCVLFSVLPGGSFWCGREVPKR